METHVDALYEVMCEHYAKSSSASHRRYQHTFATAQRALGCERAIEAAELAYARWKEANVGVCL